MSINRVTLVGHVGKAPDVKHLENESVVANFSIATTEKGYTSKSGAEIPERTEWHNIVAWNGLAKLSEGYIKKGTKLYIEGKLRTRSWDDENNKRHYITEVFADSIEIMTSGNSNTPPPLTSEDQPPY